MLASVAEKAVGKMGEPYRSGYAGERALADAGVEEGARG
jgi:hypothetical protein